MRAITDHFDRRRDELRRYASGVLSDHELDQMFGVAADGGGGIVDGAIPLDDTAVVAVNEYVEIVDGHARVRRYSYYLIVDGTEVRGYCLNPTHDPASHRHIGPHSNVEACEPVSLRAAYEEFWQVLADLRSQS